MNAKKFIQALLVSAMLLGGAAACVPAASAPAAQAASAVQVSAATATPAAPASSSSTAKVNLNTATQAQFLAIQGVGDRMTREFMEYRPYSTILQFEKEIGKYVSADQVKIYEQSVYVPISVNSSDAATLMQIPGLDQAGAQSLVTGRPYANNDAFLASLAKLVSADTLASAKTMLGN